jgi:type IV pilus assembly protein PilB
MAEALEEISQTTLKIEESNQSLESIGSLKDAPVARIVNILLETAVKNNASDIHLEPEDDNMRIRYRVDGILSERHILPKAMQDSIVARIKILSNLKIDEKRIPQDGRFKVQVGESVTDLRVSTLPTVNGEKVVIRLLKNEANIYTFKDLGLGGLSLRRFEEGLLRSNGIIIITGPTGSGKTVTLATALSKLNSVKVNIVTVEDPIEYQMPRINQTQTKSEIGLTFANGLRTLLRQDPDIIMVGEVRDGETASLSINAALTGHLVLSTIHTNSAAGAIPRMMDMGVEPFLLVSTLKTIISQRLVRKLAEEKQQYFLNETEIANLAKIVDLDRMMNFIKSGKLVPEDATWDKIPFYKPKPTAEAPDGYKGRVGIHEVLKVSLPIKELILKSAISDEIEKQAKSEGMMTILEDGIFLVVSGVTSMEEVLRVVSE